ncbi:uncharacterized protein LOC133806438 [Humulus lupulus]|uniref:uncharacterized protein LOC133806438 n=1 Tax=Humulus lupulus TaxID=3486 RepID=UPI002B41554D|nr:uncharacterized protein LOC133806438 [Humulus lupulus]
MDIEKVYKDAQCRIFPATLSNAAQEWYFKFQLTTITSREMLAKEFYGQFYVAGIHPTEANQLVDILQKDDEPLKESIQRFMRIAAHAKSVGHEGKMMAIIVGVKRQSHLWNNIQKME